MSKYTAEQVAREADLQEDHIADMLRDYAALLREQCVPEGMQPSRRKPPMPIGNIGPEDFCFCNNEVSLQMVSGGGAPAGYLGKVWLKIDGEHVPYLREREAAKAGVTPEMAEIAFNAMDAVFRVEFGTCGGISDEEKVLALRGITAALEAVAPLLSVQVPDVVTPVHAASGLNASERHAWALGWNDCRDAMLAAAPNRGEG